MNGSRNPETTDLWIILITVILFYLAFVFPRSFGNEDETTSGGDSSG